MIRNGVSGSRTVRCESCRRQRSKGFRGNVFLKEYRQQMTRASWNQLPCLQQMWLSNRKLLVADGRPKSDGQCSVYKTAHNIEDTWRATDVREMKNIFSEVQMSNHVVMFRPVCLAKVVIMNTFDASFPIERKGRSQGRFLTMITTRGAKKGTSICTMSEFKKTVIRVIGSTFAAALANAVDRIFHVQLLVKA